MSQSDPSTLPVNRGSHGRLIALSSTNLTEVNAVRYSATRRFARDYPVRPLCAEDLAEMIYQGTAWGLTIDRSLVGVAYGIRFGLDFHLEFIGTRSDYSGLGLGGRLLRHLQWEAERREMLRVTLVTGATAPWNQPWYEKAGYRALHSDIEIAPYLRERRDEQSVIFAAHDLLMPRVAMVRNVMPRRHLRLIPSAPPQQGELQ